MSAPRYLVTGGAGFIGSSLCAHLVRGGARVAVLDDFVNGSRAKLADALQEVGADPGDVEVQEGDVRDASAVARAVARADAVFHLACLGVRHSLNHPRENHEVNASGTLVVLAAAREADVARFVHVSSSEVYGTARSVPMPETHPCRPHTVYGASKLAGECYARAYHDSYGYPTVVLRPFNAYGPRAHHEGDSGEVIPRFLLRALAGQPPVVFGDGTQTRDFSYVGDTARGIAEVGLHADAVGQTVNLGAGRETSILELAQQIPALIGAELQPVHEAPRPGDVLRLFADATLAEERFGYRAAVDLADGLQRLLVWYRAQGADAADLLADAPVRNWE